MITKKEISVLVELEGYLDFGHSERLENPPDTLYFGSSNLAETLSEQDIPKGYYRLTLELIEPKPVPEWEPSIKF
jgi:hypothetical protein